MILDNLKVHHARKAKDWLADREEEIEVLYLPSYSPELNPDERLNADMKDRGDPAGAGTQQVAADEGGQKPPAQSPEITTARSEAFQAQARSLCGVKTFNCRINKRS